MWVGSCDGWVHLVAAGDGFLASGEISDEDNLSVGY